MSRIAFAIFLLTVGTFLASADERPQSVDRPNVVFILADDFGCRDLSSTGSQFYETPHLDRLAAQSVRFTNGYATCQVCSPSRASLMTGKYPARLKITDWIGAASGYQWKRNGKVLPVEYQHNLPADDTTLAEAFQDAGYTTFFAGKWHLGNDGSHPEDHGFDINKGGHHRGSPPGGFFSPYRNPKLTDGKPGESLTLRLAQETVQFIDEHQDQPFFAYLSFYAVHAPIQTTPTLWEKYRNKAEQLGLQEKRFLIDRTLPVRQVQDCPIYAGMVETMDAAIGSVLKKLSDTGLDKNTIVVFTSDNGGVSSGDAFCTSNLPFRGGKGRQWEGGIREPYFVKAPGVSPKVDDTPVTGTDFYPTLLQLAGLPQKPKQHVDGVSLVPLLQGQSLDVERDLFWHYPHYGNQGGEPSSIIRSGDWKLIHYWEDGRDELYNLANDISEQHDQAAAQPGQTSKLKKRLFQWLGEVEAAIPGLDPRFDQKKFAARQQQIRNTVQPNLEKRHANYLNPKFQPNKNWWGSQATID